jgi:hypothetical protein
VDIPQKPFSLDDVRILNHKPPVDAVFSPLVGVSIGAFLPATLPEEFFLRLHHKHSGNVIGSSHIQELHPFLVDVFKLCAFVVIELRSLVGKIGLNPVYKRLEGFPL